MENKIIVDVVKHLSILMLGAAISSEIRAKNYVWAVAYFGLALILIF